MPVDYAVSAGGGLLLRDSAAAPRGRRLLRLELDARLHARRRRLSRRPAVGAGARPPARVGGLRHSRRRRPSPPSPRCVPRVGRARSGSAQWAGSDDAAIVGHGRSSPACSSARSAHSSSATPNAASSRSRVVGAASARRWGARLREPAERSSRTACGRPRRGGSERSRCPFRAPFVSRARAGQGLRCPRAPCSNARRPRCRGRPGIRRLLTALGASGRAPPGPRASCVSTAPAPQSLMSPTSSRQDRLLVRPRLFVPAARLGVE